MILHSIEDITHFPHETLISGNFSFCEKMPNTAVMGDAIFLTRLPDEAMNENKWHQFVSKATVRLLEV